MISIRPVVALLFTAGPAAAESGVRAVWLQQLSGEPDPHATAPVYRLMARELPGGPRPLLPGPGDFSRPLLSADGGTVYYTVRNAAAREAGTSYRPEIRAVPFAGGEPRSLGEGMVVAVWRSPEGHEFLYALSSLQTSRRPGLTGELLVRFQASSPDDREIMWTDTPLGADNFQISRDGTRAAGLFPWPQTGLADLNGKTFTPLAQGSFPSLAPDDSYAAGVLDGDRRRFRLFVPNVEPGWDLLPAQKLPQQAGQINHPRWSNDPLYITFSGPPAAGDAPDVYLAKLRPDLRSIEQATPLSTDQAPAQLPDYYPDVWVAGGHERTTELVQRPVITPPPRAAKWPVSDDALHFAWENRAAPGGEEAFTLRGFAAPGRNGALNVSAGWAEAAGPGIQELAAACASRGSFSLEALITERLTPAPCSLRLVSLRTADGRDAFALYRVDRSLVVRLLTGGAQGRPVTAERHTLTTLAIEDDRPFSVIVTVHAGRLTFYLDGQVMKEVALDQPGLAAWKDLRLQLGDAEPYGTPWTGTAERIAAYSRALAAAEVTEAWAGTQSLLTARQRPARNKIKARLVEMPPLPPAADLTAAPRWLHASSWEIEQVYTGYLKPGKITLLQWVQLDGKPVPLPDMKPGQSIELPIESLEDHPELSPEKTSQAVTGGEQPVFFDATPPGRHPKPFPAP